MSLILAAAVVAATPVVAIVEVPSPWYAPRALIVGKMRDTLPQYRNLPGLVHKSYSFAEGGPQRGAFGGIYLWRDRDSAQAWFDERWFARVRQERGVEARVRLIDAPRTLGDAGRDAVESRDAVATLVEFGVAPPLELAAGMRRVSALEAGQRWLALWTDRASAEAWLATLPQPPKQVEWFATPIATGSARPENALAAPQP